VVDDLVLLDRRICDALTVLRGARALVWHSANVQTLCVQASAERTLDELLDQRPALPAAAVEVDTHAEVPDLG